MARQLSEGTQTGVGLIGDKYQQFKCITEFAWIGELKQTGPWYFGSFLAGSSSFTAYMHQATHLQHLKIIHGKQMLQK